MQRATNRERNQSRGREPGVSELLNGKKAQEGTEGEELSDDDVFEVLYNRRRRDVLSYLCENDGRATQGELAEYIAAKENDTVVQRLSSYERKRVYVGLYQNHLPMMDDVGVIDYNKNRGTVRLTESATPLEPYLDEIDEPDLRRPKGAGAVALAGVILLGVLEVGTLNAAPTLLWVVLGVVGLSGLVALDAHGLAPGDADLR